MNRTLECTDGKTDGNMDGAYLYIPLFLRKGDGQKHDSTEILQMVT
jgi:hypothetical protein